MKACMRGALEEISVKSLRAERPDLPGFVRPSRGLSPINAGVTQLDRVRGYYPLSRGIEARPRHQFNGYPVREHRAAATRQRPVKETPDYTRQGNP